MLGTMLGGVAVDVGLRGAALGTQSLDYGQRLATLDGAHIDQILVGVA
jgi:hypothetical protein